MGNLVDLPDNTSLYQRHVDPSQEWNTQVPTRLIFYYGWLVGVRQTLASIFAMFEEIFISIICKDTIKWQLHGVSLAHLL